MSGFKFDLGQTIHYLRNNRPHSAPVLARMLVENAHEDWVATKEQFDLFTPFGKGRAVYATTHGPVNEDSAFASKQAMVDALLGEAYRLFREQPFNQSKVVEGP